MGVRRVDLPEGCSRWPTYRAWMEWTRRMGLDPDMIAVPGYIEADDDARTVTAPCHVRSAKDGYIEMDDSGQSVLLTVLVVQLESPALPMPKAYA
jgi:hypothetical protein